ncbi:hypothetical protein MARVELLAND_90 [Bacillus phage vB_BspM_MarvelLand]|nr:hypothetical protein MARVELLAND_90 [Bacillus phage vB_BspM_MarvelLand]
MSRRVRRRAISKCKGAKSDIRDYWRNRVRNSATNLTPEYMLSYRNGRRQLFNELHHNYTQVLNKARAEGVTINLNGTKTGRFTSNEPNIAGTPKTIGGKDHE